MTVNQKANKAKVFSQRERKRKTQHTKWEKIKLGGRQFKLDTGAVWGTTYLFGSPDMLNCYAL
jgi:hypothetical protein